MNTKQENLNNYKGTKQKVFIVINRMPRECYVTEVTDNDCLLTFTDNESLVTRMKFNRIFLSPTEVYKSV